VESGTQTVPEAFQVDLPAIWVDHETKKASIHSSAPGSGFLFFVTPKKELRAFISAFSFCLTNGLFCWLALT
jgi:hypothetical protein